MARAKKRYSKYGFSFEYPSGMTLSEKGLLESEANDNSGTVVVETKDQDHVLVFVSWVKSPKVISLWHSLNGAFNSIEGSPGVQNLIREPSETSTMKDGHRMLYQHYTLVSGVETINGIYGVWYDEVSERLYQLNLMYNGKDLLEVYRQYLDSLVCHQ